MLEVRELSCGYGDMIAVDNLSFTVERGEIFGLIGANGAGKTSTIMTIAGLTNPRSGQVILDGTDITSVPAHLRLHKGLALVPEGRRIFPDLSVDENLIIGGTLLDSQTLKKNQNQIYEIFPQLAARKKQRSGSLSGGEQQMLAMGRAIMAQPRILLVDELSLGLMPIVIDECYKVLQHLQENGIAILLVEQNTERVLQAAHQIAVMESGRMVWSGSGQDARKDHSIFDAYLGTVENPA